MTKRLYLALVALSICTFLLLYMVCSIGPDLDTLSGDQLIYTVEGRELTLGVMHGTKLVPSFVGI